MIRLNKGPKPQVLIDNEDTWTAEYEAFVAEVPGTPQAAKYRYRHSEIKSALRRECFDKCIYCEAKISHVFPGETDHIYPVSKRHDLAVAWENLAYICKECNREKKDYYDLNEPLINPFVDDPADFLLFLGPMVVCRGVDPRGHRTIMLLKLQKRMSLVERRAERLERVLTLIQLYEDKPEGPTKELIKSEILEEASPDKEFSAYVREFLLARCGWRV